MAKLTIECWMQNKKVAEESYTDMELGTFIEYAKKTIQQCGLGFAGSGGIKSVVVKMEEGSSW